MPTRHRAVRVPVDLGVVVAVQVDEAGRDDQPRRIEDLGPCRVVDAADLGDAAAGDADIGDDPRQARPVDHGAVLDHDVIHGEPPVMCVSPAGILRRQTIVSK